jgi:hypothetical protein
MTTQLELEHYMDMNTRNQACAQAATALRDAWTAMEAALGLDEAMELANDLNLGELIECLDGGVPEQVAREIFRDAWELMDQALGYEASSDLAEESLVTIIYQLERQEFVGVAE